VNAQVYFSKNGTPLLEDSDCAVVIDGQTILHSGRRGEVPE
jgi:hypothetical protein